MERSIGMDVHAASCTLAVISQTGKRLKDFPVETHGQARVEAVRMIPGHKHRVFEEGLQSAWSLRDAATSRGRDRGHRDHAEPGAEERPARCVWPGREASRGEPRQAGVQGAASVHATARTLADPHDVGDRRCTCAVSDQELVSISGRSGLRRECLWGSSARGVAEAALGQCPDQSDAALRVPRLLAGAEEAGRGRSGSRGEEAPHRPDPADCAGLRTDPSRPARSDRRTRSLSAAPLIASERSDSSGATAGLGS